MTGDIKTPGLVISKQLRMNINNYRNIFPHVAAAIQLSYANGKKPMKGDVIQYVYTNSQHQNPINRVAAAGIAIDNYSNLEYDREKYKEMLLDAGETVLGIFGFDRILYGKPKDKRWWMELKRNRSLDLNAETRN